jgi:hypothetical protein
MMGVQFVEDHQEKLTNYMSDPLAYDNLGSLAAATPEMQENLYQGRVVKLAGHIKQFEKELEKCRAQHGGG